MSTFLNPHIFINSNTLENRLQQYRAIRNNLAIINVYFVTNTPKGPQMRAFRCINL